MPDLRNGRPLSSGDALFLYLEREGTPLNVASVSVFEGVIPLELCTQFIESKLSLIPRYRQRVVAPPFNIDLPSWQYDPDFDVRNHVREVKLKRGTEGEFKAAAGKILSTRMNREHPLWDFTLLQGLKGDHTGMVIRIHHCLADGISGVGLMNVIMDPSPSAQPLPKKKRPYHAPPVPASSLMESLISSGFSAVGRILAVQSELLDMARYFVAAAQPEGETNLQAGANSGAGIPAIGELSRLILEFGSPTERLPFNVICRGPQKFGWTEISLSEMKAVKEACGATINDVVLTIVTGAIRRYADLHRARLSGRSVRIIVPVNLRGEGDINDLGNRITFLPVNVPLDIRDPRKLIDAVRVAVTRARGARMAELVSLVGTLVKTIPPSVQAIIGPLAGQLPLSVCNTICTNVPGPKDPLYLLGHKMLSCYPYVPIGGEMGMNCAVLTYNGTAFFGFTGDSHAIPDIERLEEFLNTSFSELQKAVGIRPPTKKHLRPIRSPKQKRPRPKAQKEPLREVELKMENAFRAAAGGTESGSYATSGSRTQFHQ